MNMDEAAKHLYDSSNFQTLVPNLQKSLEKNHFQAQGLSLETPKKNPRVFLEKCFRGKPSQPTSRLVSEAQRSRSVLSDPLVEVTAEEISSGKIPWKTSLMGLLID